MQVKKLTDLDVKGKRVFIRADLNVPQDDAGNITEDTRIRASIPSIKFALEGGAAVMVTSHLGRRTEGELNADDTLAPVAVRLGQMLGELEPLVAADQRIDTVQAQHGQLDAVQPIQLQRFKGRVGQPVERTHVGASA